MKQESFWKAVSALCGWCTKILGEITILEDSVIDGAKNELCKTPEDIKKSRTTARIIALTEQRAWDTLDIKNSNISALSVYAKLVFKTPMTQKEKDYLIRFFRDDNTQKTVQDILSKLNLLYWNENSEFIESFLKNEDWKLDIFWFVQYIIKQLKEYELIIPDEAEDIREMKEKNESSLDKLKWEEKFYIYKLNWKFKICAVSDWKIFFLDDSLDNAGLLKNWLIHWISENEWEDLLSWQRKTWHLYEFYSEKWFFEVRNMPWIPYLDIVPSLSSELNIVFKTQNESWKEWLLEMAKENKEENEWEFKTLLAENNNGIIVNGKFITSISRWENTDFFYTYIKLQDIGIACWYLKRVNTTSAKKENSYFTLNDLWDNLILIKTNGRQSVYRYNKWGNELETTDSALMNMSSVIIDNLLSWKPTVITKEEVDKWWFGLYVFDKKTWIVKMLIEETNFTHRVNSDQIRSRVGNKYFIHYWKNWVLYRLKDWYKYNHNYWAEYIQKWLFWDRIYLDESFENTKEYLESIDADELPVTLI
ncbi:MAG: hypothetical protein ACD_49C00009G0030 [uncultured bacterium (gcode 4)]|uniref:Uncharacterized protein n=1 Tax=uncultured bacterium (gcode 4) TaxID=1234023 RepID=K2AFM0_9BACT|nr:MAG: hypothetical protein ACD_49C00009G0030 [uncultured bacterium (gcode 4)]